MKQKGIIFIVIGILLIGFGITKYKKSTTIVSNSIHKEYRNSYTIKSYNLENRNRYSFPALEGNPFYCMLNTSFMANCYGKGYSLSLEMYSNYYDKMIQSEIDAKKRLKGFKSIEEIECIENATCYKLDYDESSTLKEHTEIYIVIKNSDADFLKADYKFLSDYDEKKLEYIFYNIKVTNDATYTIGEEKDDKLNIYLKTDANEKDNKYVELSLDKNKYTEVEFGSNDINHTRLKTENGDTIDLYVENNLYAYEDSGYVYYQLSDSYTGYIFSINTKTDTYSTKYETIKKDGKTLYKMAGYSGTTYGIESGNDVLFIVHFSNKADETLIDDFMNFKSGMNK